MKQKIEQLLIKSVHNEFVWKVLKPLATSGMILSMARNNLEKEREREDMQRDYFKSLTVLNGPFKGMKYPRLDSVGSMIYPKLLGSYELELQGCVEALLQREYSEIIDVGCAEGYYAIGFALRMPAARVYAYDTEPKAQALCKEMAGLNGVSEKVEVRATLTPQGMAEFPFTGRGLVILDCEGYEKILLNRDSVINLRNCDLLIETHDCLDITISTTLRELLGATHSIETVLSTDDIQKALTYRIPQLEGCTLEEKRLLLAERRTSIMEWLVCTAKDTGIGCASRQPI